MERHSTAFSGTLILAWFYSNFLCLWKSGRDYLCTFFCTWSSLESCFHLIRTFYKIARQSVHNCELASTHFIYLKQCSNCSGYQGFDPRQFIRYNLSTDFECFFLSFWFFRFCLVLFYGAACQLSSSSYSLWNYEDDLYFVSYILYFNYNFKIFIEIMWIFARFYLRQSLMHRIDVATRVYIVICI